METSQENQNKYVEHKKSTSQSQLLEIDRKFNAPVERLFEAFANPQDLKIWWWPKGLYTDRVEIDFREGGKFFINMKGYDQGGGGMTGTFEEIIKNKRIVMSDQFADENGHPISPQEAKMPGVWPESAYITLDFKAVDPNTSHLTLFQEGIPNEAQDDCKQGWSEMFDKLESHLLSSSIF